MEKLHPFFIIMRLLRNVVYIIFSTHVNNFFMSLYVSHNFKTPQMSHGKLIALLFFLFRKKKKENCFYNMSLDLNDSDHQYWDASIGDDHARKLLKINCKYLKGIPE